MAQRLIKYMGTADIRVLNKGDDFDGQLRDGLSKELVFDAGNRWVVDVDGLSEDEVALILEHDGFKDVTDMTRIPSNDHQKMFLGHKATSEAPATDENQNPSGSVGDAGGGTTVGGSTAGDTGGKAKGGRGGTTVGGSTS